MTPDRAPAPTILVLGGDAVVGQALELLLWNADWNVKFLTEPSLEESELLDGIGLLLLAPGLSTERRKALLTLVGSTLAMVRIPILELVDDPESSQGAQVESGHLVPWPCRPEDLKRHIDAALLAGPRALRDPQVRRGERGIT